MSFKKLYFFLISTLIVSIFMYQLDAAGQEVLTFNKLDTGSKDVRTGDTNVAVIGFSLHDNINGAVLKQIRVTADGSNVGKIIDNSAKLWLDNGSTANEWDSGDTLITNLYIGIGAEVFTNYGLHYLLQTNTINNFIVTFNITHDYILEDGLWMKGILPANGLFITNSTTGSQWNVPTADKTNTNPVNYIKDELPVLTNASAKATIIFGSDNLSVKLNSVSSFTLNVTYKDAESDVAGWMGYATNIIWINVYTNDGFYGSLLVKTNGGAINYTSGYEFTFISTGAKSNVFYDISGLPMTNSFANLTLAYGTNVEYEWGAKAISGNTNNVNYTNSGPRPQIIIDDTPPALPATISVRSNEALGNALDVIWAASSSSDLDHYVVVYGTNKIAGLSTTNVGTATNVQLYPLISDTLYYVRLYAYDGLNNETNSTWYSNTTLNAIPTLTSPNVVAQKVNGFNVKGKSSDKFTFQITYSDAEGDKAGFVPVATNLIAIDINTNGAFYGSIIVFTNGGTINYTNGYQFTFTNHGNEDIVFYNGPNMHTNTFANLYATYGTNLRYLWYAKAVSGNTNAVKYPTSPPYPTITIDDTPPSAVTVTAGSITTTSAKLSWTAPSDSDLSTTPYLLAWGKNLSNLDHNCGSPFSTTYYDITSLDAGTKYYYTLGIRDDVDNITAVTGFFTTSAEATTSSGIAGDEGEAIDAANAAKDAVAIPSVADKGDSVYFTYTKPSTEVKIYNLVGTKIATITADVSKNYAEWQVPSNIASGIYFAAYEDASCSKKVVKFIYGVKK